MLEQTLSRPPIKMEKPLSVIPETIKAKATEIKTHSENAIRWLEGLKGKVLSKPREVLTAMSTLNKNQFQEKEKPRVVAGRELIAQQLSNIANQDQAKANFLTKQQFATFSDFAVARDMYDISPQLASEMIARKDSYFSSDKQTLVKLARENADAATAYLRSGITPKQMEVDDYRAIIHKIKPEQMKYMDYALRVKNVSGVNVESIITSLETLPQEARSALTADITQFTAENLDFISHHQDAFLQLVQEGVPLNEVCRGIGYEVNKKRFNNSMVLVRGVKLRHVISNINSGLGLQDNSTAEIKFEGGVPEADSPFGSAALQIGNESNVPKGETFLSFYLNDMPPYGEGIYILVPFGEAMVGQAGFSYRGTADPEKGGLVHSGGYNAELNTFSERGTIIEALHRMEYDTFMELDYKNLENLGIKLSGDIQQDKITLEGRIQQARTGLNLVDSMGIYAVTDKAKYDDIVRSINNNQSLNAKQRAQYLKHVVFVPEGSSKISNMIKSSTDYQDFLSENLGLDPKQVALRLQMDNELCLEGNLQDFSRMYVVSKEPSADNPSAITGWGYSMVRKLGLKNLENLALRSNFLFYQQVEAALKASGGDESVLRNILANSNKGLS